MECELEVATPIEELILVKNMYNDSMVKVSIHELEVDLILLDIQNFDVIFAMDWLVCHHATVDYFCKEVTFRKPRKLEFIFCGEHCIISSCVVPVVIAR